ncbi:MAG TPA: glycosyl hydrolase-related protein, partial [Acidobacteriaceae bacterium]|nr:glycosyl hydrolase-related protein [Acidobacteriaceae bacterium]
LTTSECRHPSARAIVSGNMISVVRAGFLALLFSALPTWLFAQVGSSPAKTDVYVIPFSHLDLFWGGTQEEDLSRGNRIIARALELAQEHPEFRFLLEDNVFVANFMDSQRGTPQAEALRELVKAGRIEIAPKWAAIYQNLPRGEALVRNLTYGKRYAREVFDVDPLVAHVGDIPGFTRQYPQLLSKAGIPYMVMTRMGPVDTPFFRWKAPDGSGVLVWDAVKGYGWGVNLGLHHDLDDAAMARVKEQVTQVQMLTKAPIYLGWGTDLFAPDEQLIDNVNLLSRKLAPMQFQFATPAEYFRAASKTSAIPELSGEITGSWANVDSSATPVWPPAITAADALVSAEKFAAINDALGFAPYPQDKFDHLWRKAIEGMDHNFYGQGGDIGDARKIGYSEAAILEGGEILRNSLRNIAERVRHPATKATAIVVFNPLSWTRDDSVRTHVTVYGDVAPRDIDDYRKGMRLVDEQGNSIPFDVESYSQNMSRAMMLAFTAQQVPSLGYKTYYLEPAPAAPPAAAAQVRMDDVKDADNPFRVAGADVVENRFYRLAVDRPTGRIEIFDKQLNKAISKDIEVSGAEERGGDAISVFPYTGRTIVNVIRSVELVHNGSSETVLRISGDLAGEPVTQQITLYRDLRKIDIEDTIDWKPGRYMEIQQVFPLDLTGAEVRNGVPFGSAAAGDMMPDAGPRSHDEVPMAVWKGWRQIQSWISASSPDSTITISADHQLFTVDDHAIRADMIRGTSFNQLKTFQDGRPVAVQQPRAGRYVFRYSISSAEGNWEKAQAWRRGMEWNTPLIGVVSEDELSPKSLPAERSFLSVQGATLVVSALKKADRGDGLVMRLFNETGESSDTQIHFLDQAVSFQKVNLLEEPLSTATERLLHVRPFEIDTVELPTSLR